MRHTRPPASCFVLQLDGQPVLQAGGALQNPAGGAAARKIPGAHKTNDITLKRGVMNSTALLDWTSILPGARGVMVLAWARVYADAKPFMRFWCGSRTPKEALLVYHDPAGIPRKTWFLRSATSPPLPGEVVDDMTFTINYEKLD